MLASDISKQIWEILQPYVVGSMVSSFTALVIWIIRTFNKHSDAVRDILHILTGIDGKNGMRSDVKECKEDISELKTDVTRIKTTLKID